VVGVVAMWSVTVDVAGVCNATVTETTATGTPYRRALGIVVTAALSMGSAKPADAVSASWLVPAMGFVVDDVH